MKADSAILASLGLGIAGGDRPKVFRVSQSKIHSTIFFKAIGLTFAASVLWLTANSSAATPPPGPPTTPREFFNAGTQKLRDGKLREAEAFLESALASQIERLQPPALYNLGHVRFGQGVEELKKGPAAAPTAARGRAAAQAADEAIRNVDNALNGKVFGVPGGPTYAPGALSGSPAAPFDPAASDLERMIAAYRNGRGARKELKAALKVVKRALETHGAALGKWQRASSDFKSTVELNRSDFDARQNADTVDRWIARLIDSLRELQQMANAMGDKDRELGEKLKQLKGRIPAQDAPPGAAGDDDEEEDRPFGPQPGQQEGPSKQGEEMSLSPEQAGWLLQGFKLDSEHRLPMGQQGTAEPKNRSRPTW